MVIKPDLHCCLVGMCPFTLFIDIYSPFPSVLTWLDWESVGVLHMGQVPFSCSQGTIHCSWKTCLHPRAIQETPSLKLSLQIVHSIGIASSKKLITNLQRTNETVCTW